MTKGGAAGAPQADRRVGRLLDRIVWWCLAGVMAAMSLAMLVQVLCRVLLGTAIIWAEEFAVLLFAWSIFLGAAYAQKGRLAPVDRHASPARRAEAAARADGAAREHHRCVLGGRDLAGHRSHPSRASPHVSGDGHHPVVPLRQRSGGFRFGARLPRDRRAAPATPRLKVSDAVGHLRRLHAAPRAEHSGRLRDVGDARSAISSGTAPYRSSSSRSSSARAPTSSCCWPFRSSSSLANSWRTAGSSSGSSTSRVRWSAISGAGSASRPSCRASSSPASAVPRWPTSRPWAGWRSA